MVSTRSSSRIRQSTSPERPSSSILLETRLTKKDDFPSLLPKEERGIRSDVKKPPGQVRLTPFVHVLLCILLVCMGWYAYRRTVTAADIFKSTGTFPLSSTPLSLYRNPVWNFISQQTSRGMRGFYQRSRGPHSDVERRIEELADALGVNRVDFASAIAGAVRKLVPRASLSSLASEAKETGGGRIMEVLLGEYPHVVHIADGVKSKMG
ncbi:hypothetical protein F5148DRAFT_266373 [Russula earlei]|uniref:Uncharacterized protein n=1 Tax=Russula earlei TaxID=71964 RepID=A0ACC0UJD8_9AGAM|nr:hypothetical protein F5148DRAFT_266373 [Russula earlei]